MSDNLKIQVVMSMLEKITAPLKNISRQSDSTAKALKETRNRLKELDAQQKQVGQFRELTSGLQRGAARLKEAQDQVRTLAQQMKAAENPTRAMTREFDRAVNRARAIKEANAKQSVELQKLRTNLNAAGISTQNLGQHERALRSDIAATNTQLAAQKTRLSELAAQHHRLNAARARMEKGMQLRNNMAGTGAGMAATGAAGGAAALSPVRAYATLEDSATQMSAAYMRAGGAVPPELTKIKTLAEDLGNILPGTTADFYDMMTTLKRQGMVPQDILDGLGKSTALLSVQLKQMPQETAEFASKMQDATRSTGKEMLGLVDMIQRSYYEGLDPDNMLQGFTKIAPVMDIIKKKGLDGAKALAPFLVMSDQAGMAGEQSGNAYRKIFQAGLDMKKVGKANAALGGTGVTLDFTDGKGDFGGIDKLFVQLEKIKGITGQVQRTAVLKELFGDDSETLQTVNMLMSKGADGYREVQKKMAAQASLQERVNAQLGTLKNLWDAATGTFTNALAAFGEAIAPELKSLTKWLGEMAAGVQQWAKENPALAGTLMKILAVVALIMVGLGGLSLVLASVLGPFLALRFMLTAVGIQGGMFSVVLGTLGRVMTGLAAGMRLVGTAVMFIGRAMLMNPIGLLVTGIAVAALVLYRYWEPIKALFGSVFDSIKANYNAAVTWFSQLPAKFAVFGTNIVQGLINGIVSMGGTLKATILGIGDSVVGWFKGKLGINSPSRVFTGFGGFITEGLAIGLDRGQNEPLSAVSGLANRIKQVGAGLAIGAAIMPAIAYDTRPPVSGSAQPVMVDSHDTIQIHVHAAPGMDAHAIAAAVRVELDRRDREKAARRRSSFFDPE